MPLRLWQRLFLAFATLSVLALAGFAVWQQQSFRRGFLGYLEKVALERLEPASTRLANAYAENGNRWDFLRDRPDRFGELIEDRRQRVGRPPPDENAPRRDGPPPGWDESPPPEPPPGEDRPPPDIAVGVGMPPGRRGPPPRGPPDLMPRLLLVDANGVRVAGNPGVPPDAPIVPVELDGARIGMLRLAPLPQLNDAMDLAFAREQLR